MSMALELARRGAGRTSPNPMVGAVIVKDGAVIGRGWHRQYGGLHAEREALADCAGDPHGATMYVTLEPCCHQGKQPPCTDALLESGIRRVVVGARDPNPLMSGNGLRILRKHGVEVTEGVLAEACTRLNEVFFHFIRTGRPFVVMKYAMTMDGKTAACTGRSRWITGPAAREHVHRLRDRYRAILVGVGTVLADDPLLTCRLPGGRDPLRVVCDTHLRTPLSARLVTTARETSTLLATCCTDPAQRALYEQAGCRVLVLPEREGHVDLDALMAALGRDGVDSVLLEGGGTLNWAALNTGVVQKVLTYVAPKLLGGRDAPTPISGPGIPDPELAVRLRPGPVTRVGDDILLESEVIPCVHGDH